MLFKLLLVFTIVPLVELALLIKLAQVTDIRTTIAIVLVTGLAGAYLARTEGTLILYKIKQELNEGRIPGTELINGLCVIVGSALLITPGIISDIVGITLALPITRRFYGKIIKKVFSNMIRKGTVGYYFKRWK
ncbi:hypothetical protein CLPU_4c01760 [Gottschalkia purinilytica]|uniref:FxsA cytoplasmic membrane protein n=1 Tax=Gottschalkia purinilytica TaxID=1503 RepID=A0A0L0WCJ1_GOTPU|nr:FxsA family protein [Gottschalkia purinilytica]KNF09130.1 hypothetical protein CLPU_4c01760 [Gottschalkia purinilytica]